MEINQNYCRNRLVELDGNMQMLQAASLYFQCAPWPSDKMRQVLWNVAETSLEILSDSLPEGWEDG